MTGYQCIGIFALVLAVALAFITYQAWDEVPVSIQIVGGGLSVMAVGVGVGFLMLKAGRIRLSAGDILITGSLWVAVFIALGMIVAPMIQQSMVH